MHSSPSSPGEGTSRRFDPPPPRRERNVARHATRDLVFPAAPYDRRFRKLKKTEGGHEKQIFREHGGQVDRENWSMAARTPLPPTEAGEAGNDSDGWMDMEAETRKNRRPAHERAGDYRSARSFHIQPSEHSKNCFALGFLKSCLRRLGDSGEMVGAIKSCRSFHDINPFLA